MKSDNQSNIPRSHTITLLYHKIISTIQTANSLIINCPDFFFCECLNQKLHTLVLSPLLLTFGSVLKYGPTTNNTITSSILDTIPVTWQKIQILYHSLVFFLSKQAIKLTKRSITSKNTVDRR